MFARKDYKSSFSKNEKMGSAVVLLHDCFDLSSAKHHKTSLGIPEFLKKELSFLN